MDAKTCRGNADRALARSARLLHSWPFNISIRAKFGETVVVKQNMLIFTIDKWWLAIYYCVIEWPAVYCILMSEMEKINAVEIHRKSCPGSLEWFAGVRIAPRLHPWDGQEPPYSTKAWMDIRADTAQEAHKIAKKLFELGYGKSPIHTNSPSGEHVFAYAINNETFNRL